MQVLARGFIHWLASDEISCKIGLEGLSRGNPGHLLSLWKLKHNHREKCT